MPDHETTELDPQLAAVVDDIEAEGVPEWHAMSVDCGRRVEDEVFTSDERADVEFVRDYAFDGPNGDVPVRVYCPGAETIDTPAPTLVFYHGGGWTLGTLDSADDICRNLARRVGGVVVSVDYRLAPEHPFPAGLDDAYAALEWAAENAETFGGDGSRLVVAGTSAGGNLAAAVALRAREFDGPDVAHQALFYPITDYAFDTDSYAENADGPLLTRADMQWFWAQYLRSPVDGANPYASVLHASESALSELPPATVVTAGFDPLRDEGVAYADRLAAAGVDVNHHHHPTMTHGFLSLTDSVDVADEAFDAVAERLRASVGVGGGGE
ncbi:alpha/beta hydrolase [Halogranum rubrum]|uniref:Alpha/beta hydrolase fold-3 domain protein n=1 Tax=Halogranum salarium B-1 TaxID=1210908 RepID=J2ZL00_9EURY|nr:alpha/beta hydrolase [Halogranum salarium]EJN61405.1 alpha/beta hydrolase fold-3 domain protein [Halogranum salarium B-1]